MLQSLFCRLSLLGSEERQEGQKPGLFGAGVLPDHRVVTNLSSGVCVRDMLL